MQKAVVVKKSGSWYVRGRKPELVDGKLVRRGVWKRLAPVDSRYRSKRDVAGLAQKWIDSLNSIDTESGGTQRLSDFIEHRYFPNVEKRPSTIYGYKHIFNKHLKARLGDVRVYDFTTGIGQKLLRQIAAETDLAHTSLKHIKHFLTGVFTFAKQESVINTENPMRDVGIPKGADSEDTYAYSLEEVTAMIEALPEPAKTVVATAAFTGLRRSELRGLRWEDLSEDELRVTRTVWNTHVEEKTKTPASNAPVPLVPILQRWLTAHRNRATEGYIFAGPKMNRPLNLANLARRVIVPKLDAAGVQWHGWHAFRRGLATNLYRIGTPEKTIQSILRHANMSTTLNLYVKPVAGDSHIAMQGLEKAFQGVRKSVRKANRQKARKTS